MLFLSGFCWAGTWYGCIFLLNNMCCFFLTPTPLWCSMRTMWRSVDVSFPQPTTSRKSVAIPPNKHLQSLEIWPPRTQQEFCSPPYVHSIWARYIAKYSHTGALDLYMDVIISYREVYFNMTMKYFLLLLREHVSIFYSY